MIIEKIHIDYFGNLTDRTFELSPGTNIVSGNNESGKSTLAAFIKFIFYGLSSKSKDGELSEKDRYINWKDGSAAGSIVISTANEKYRIERAMIVSAQKSKNGETKKSYREAVQVVDLSCNAPIKITKSPGEYFFGVDEDVYKKTTFVSQPGGTKIDADKLSDTIENILFSASEDVNIDKALKKLDAARVHLLHKSESGGQIFELEEKCAELEEKLEKAKEIGSEILEAEASLADAKRVHEKNILQKNYFEKKIAAFENAALRASFNKLHTVEAELAMAQNALAEVKEKHSANGFFPTKEYLDELETAKAKFDLAEKEASVLRSRYDNGEDAEKINKDEKKREEVITQLHSFTGKKKFFTSMALCFTVIAAFILGASVFCKISNILSEISDIMLVSAVLPVLLAVIFWILRYNVSKKLVEFLTSYDVHNENDLIKKLSVNNAEVEIKGKIDEAEAGLLKSRNELDSVASRWKTGIEISEVISLAKEAVNEQYGIRQSIEKHESMLEMLKTQLAPYDEEAVMSAENDLPENSDTDASNIGDQRKKLAFLTKSTEALEIRIHELEKKLASLYPIAENPARIAEKVALAKDFIKEYRKKHAAYMLAYEKITEAGESMRLNVAPKLAEYTSRLMSEITDGKYESIGVAGDLKLSYFADGQTRDIGHMSAGTKDAAYISLRMALINVLFKNEDPCVIFDETFSSFDDTRLKSVLKLVSGSHPGYQSLILTCGGREIANTPDCNHIHLDSANS